MAKKVERSTMTQTDSKGKVIRAPRDNSKNEVKNFRWWECKEGMEMAQAIAQTVKFISEHQSNRIEQLTVSTRLYGNTSAYSLMGTAFTRASSVNSNPTSQRISYNLCQSVIDTLVSKMAKNKVVPTYITNGGIWAMQKRAKDLTKFTQGVFYEQKVHKKSIESFRDASVWGDGFLHIFEKNERVCIEKVLPHEIFVDMIEAVSSGDGTVQQLHRVKIMDRSIALNLFPELSESILLVQPASYQEIGGQGTAADLIQVVESWHLPSGEDSGDGVHAISIGDDCIKEPYEKDYFPFAHFCYSRRLLGYYGQGACERLQNIQGEINRCMVLKQRSQWMMASFKLLIKNDSKIVSQHLNNDVGSIIRYSTEAPQYVTPPATNPELQQWIDSLIMKGYQQEGVSQLSAAAEKPLGIDSGKALRTMTNIEDDRFLFVGQMMEEFVLEVARQAVEVVKDIYKDKKSYEVIVPGTKFMETVDWKNIDLDDSEYVLKAFPTSSLSDDLTGRLSEIQELAQAGMISPRTAQRLMDMPDVEMEESLATASEDLLHRVFEEMLDTKKFRQPEPEWDLQLAKQLCLEYINYAQYMNCPDDRVSILRQFNVALNDLIAAAQPPAQPGQQPGAPAVPAAPPVSNLLPNVQNAA